MSDNKPPTENEDPKQDPTNPPAKEDDKSKESGSGGGDDKKKNWSSEDYEKKLAEVRGEAAERRKAAAELQKKLDSIEEDKKKAEVESLKEQGKHKEAAEKVQKDFDDYKKISEERQIRAEAKVAAIAAGMNPNASKFLDTSNVKYDESGELVGIVEAIEAMRKELPELFKAEQDKSRDVKTTGSDKGDPDPAKKPSKPTALATDAKGDYLISDAEMERQLKERVKNL